MPYEFVIPAKYMCRHRGLNNVMSPTYCHSIQGLYIANIYIVRMSETEMKTYVIGTVYASTNKYFSLS